ncbi:alpha-galactosidase a precursor [Xylaria arbuscula]|nr:alpha-galactosidase a precursor [Xylaria arbuscula]
MAYTSRDIQLQACLANPDSVSDIIPPDDTSSESALRSGLPNFPPGDWNKGHVAKDKVTGDITFTTSTRHDLPRVKNIWHKKTIDHHEVTSIVGMRQNIRLVTSPLFKHEGQYKFVGFPWQIPITEKETAAHTFVGHVTETGRVIGFLLENILRRTAKLDELEKCHRVDINNHKFLVREEEEREEAVLLDFDTTIKCQDEKALEKEFEGLRERLEQNDGGGLVELEGEIC